MAKIYFDYDSIDSKVISKLNKAQSYYSKASGSINYRIPNDCAYLSYLRELNSKITGYSIKNSKIK